jgi:poly(3-hydroxybutyrate) depolymerase
MPNSVIANIRALAVAFAVTLCAISPVAAKSYDKVADVAGTPVHYKVVLPKTYDENKAYPAILAFPPGAQDAQMVLTTVERNWAREAEQRGYIVIVPSAPMGRLFFEEGARVFPGFIDQMLREYKIRDNRFHIAGMSNGGISAFFIAAAYPQYFVSITGFPGYLQDATPARVQAISHLCIDMYVGELDTGWRTQMKQQADQFRAQGLNVQFSVEQGEAHVMSTLTGDGAARLFTMIEKYPQGCGK